MDHATSPATAAMNIAANFHRDIQACKTKQEQQQLHRQYRDKILTIDQLGANIAAAFLPFLGPSGSREGGSADAEQWSDFERLAQRGKNMRDRQSQHIRHQSGVIAAWGGERFHYYGWEALPLPLLRQLHELAVLVPCWTDVVDLLNSKMLARHELRMLRGNNKALLIGEHSAASKVQNRHSPVERSDIISALEAARQRAATPLDLRQEMDLAAEQVNRASLGAFGLKRDLYSMIVPSVEDGGSEEAAASPSFSFSFSSPSQPPDRSVPSKVPKRIRSVPSTAQFSKRLAASSECGLGRTADIESDREFSEQRILDSRVQAGGSSYSPGAHPPEQADSESSSEGSVEVTETLDAICGHEGTDEPDYRPGRPGRVRPNSDVEGRRENDNRGSEATTSDVGSNKGDDEANDGTGAQGEEMDIEPADEPDLEGVRRIASESHDALPHTVAPLDGPYVVEIEVLDALFHLSRENSSAQMETQARHDVANPDVPALQAPGSSTSSSIEMLDASGVQAHTGAFNEPGASSRSIPTLLQTLQARYDPEISRFINKLRGPHSSDDAAPHRLLQLGWLETQNWASIYVEPEQVLGRSCVASRQEADVWYLDWDTFRSYGESDSAFERPVVIKQRFQDRGMYNIAEYIDMLWQRFPEQEVLIQNSMSGTRNSMSVKDYCITVADVDLSSPESAAPVSNVINLGRLAQADEPLLTRLPRFGLLSMLADRVAGVTGRSSQLKLSEVKSNLGFNMLGFSGAFSGSRVDPLVGSWVRCLAGFSVWAIATDLTAKEWEEFSRDGCNWSPEGKARLIVLEQDDVLLMPPGLLAVHANFVPRRWLAEGGMLWDECRIPEIIEGLLYIAKNQQHIDMPPGIELAALIDALEAWLDADDYIYPSSHSGNTNEYNQAVRASIKSLRETF
ncbi:hypothetical protein EsDP_00007270 [Epichloe bromicola]|uniref:Uncharacterized protein n=1 Tax=Epichloe bromicola TaxID=79588 RepID=A0ABQ0D036_9HYPO